MCIRDRLLYLRQTPAGYRGSGKNRVRFGGFLRLPDRREPVPRSWREYNFCWKGGSGGGSIPVVPFPVGIGGSGAPVHAEPVFGKCTDGGFAVWIGWIPPPPPKQGSQFGSGAETAAGFLPVPSDENVFGDHRRNHRIKTRNIWKDINFPPEASGGFF